MSTSAFLIRLRKPLGVRSTRLAEAELDSLRIPFGPLDEIRDRLLARPEFRLSAWNDLRPDELLFGRPAFKLPATLSIDHLCDGDVKDVLLMHDPIDCITLGHSSEHDLLPLVEILDDLRPFAIFSDAGEAGLFHDPDFLAPEAPALIPPRGRRVAAPSAGPGSTPSSGLQLAWRVETESAAHPTLWSSGDGSRLLYIHAASIHCLDGASGSAIWSSTGADDALQLGVYGETAIVTAKRRRAFALDLSSGALLWEAIQPATVHEEGCMLESGLVVFVGGSGESRSTVFALEPRTGKLIWETVVGGYGVSRLCLGAAGLLAAIGERQELLDPQAGRVLARERLPREELGGGNFWISCADSLAWCAGSWFVKTKHRALVLRGEDLATVANLGPVAHGPRHNGSFLRLAGDRMLASYPTAEGEGLIEAVEVATLEPRYGVPIRGYASRLVRLDDDRWAVTISRGKGSSFGPAELLVVEAEGGREVLRAPWAPEGVWLSEPVPIPGGLASARWVLGSGGKTLEILGYRLER